MSVLNSKHCFSRMIEESKLSFLVSDIVHENQNKYCRLCLERVDDDFLRFDDYLNNDIDCFENLAELLKMFLGEEICQDIPGIDVVCVNCADKTLATISFIKNCEKSTQILHKVFDDLNRTLNIDIESSETGERLYIVVGKEDSKLVFAKKDKIDNVKSIKVKCRECDEIFCNIQQLKEHNETTHDKYTCTKCLEVFLTENDLIEHADSTENFTCPECHQYRCTKKSLKKHQDEQHTNYICKGCGKTFRGLHKLQSHELRHKVKSTCPKCGKHYITKEFYLRHIKLCLENQLDPHPMRSKLVKTHFCDKCGKGYSTPGGLRVHERFVHGNAKPHVCKYCNKGFTAPSYLKIHLVTHTGEKKFPCEICQRKFVSKEALLYHTRRHTGEKPYSCQLCDERFVNASTRAEHIKFKHIGPTLLCEICSQKFVTPSFLRQHMKKHHDPTNKLYTEWTSIPSNITEQNISIS